MVLKGKGKVYRKGRTVYIYVPTDVANDSQFPFRPNQDVIVEIDPDAKALVVKRLE